VEALTKLYERRGVLRETHYGRMGNVVFPAFPELLGRPPRQVRRGEAARSIDPDFERRRSDGMEAIIRVLLVLASCCDWTTMEVKDPQGGYLSVWRIAELAHLPALLVAPRDQTDRRRRFRQDTVERALRALRNAHIIAFTKQHREALRDGRHTTTAPALRKIAVSFFRKFGGALLKTFDWRRGRLKERASRHERAAFRACHNVDLRVAGDLTRLVNRHPSPAPEPPSNASGPATPLWDWRTVPVDLTDAIHAEHPDWGLPELFAEARRRSARGPAPPGSSSGEPHA